MILRNRRPIKTILLCGIFILTVIPRLYKISAPVADWHSWRQSDTAAVARNFLKFGTDPLHPRYDDLSNIQSGKNNPEGYRMVEFPLYQMTAVFMSSVFSAIPIELSLRLLSILSQAGSAVIIALIVGQNSGIQTGVIAALLFAFFPFNIYFGRTILPENMAVFFALVSVYALQLFASETNRRRVFLLILASACGAATILVKPTAAFLLIPAGYIWITRLIKLNRRDLVFFAVFTAICLFPFWWWRVWISQFPEGIPASDWLLNGGDIRFKGAWFFWLFADRIARLILGYWGIMPFAFGLLIHRRKDSWIPHMYVIGMLLYFVIFARGNVQHDYYQIVIVPVLAILSAHGIMEFLKLPQSPWYLKVPMTAVTLVFAFAFSWYTVRTYYWINRPEIIEAGQVADRLLPKDAKVIAPYNGDTTFLYQTNRQGWPIGFDIPYKIDNGAGYYVTVSPNDTDFETKELAEKFTVLVRNDRFAIIDLTKPKQ